MGEAGVKVREISESDVEAAHAVLYKTWLETYPNKEYGITVEKLQKIVSATLTSEEISKRKAFLKKIPENTCSLVATLDGKVVGVCGGNKTEGVAKLKSIYVLPEHQGKGIGKSLWLEFKRWAATDKILVSVATYNKKAISFYERMGFKDTGKRFTEERFTFPDGSSIPEMEMELNL